MRGMNKIILVGNVGRDPEVRTLESGSRLARFSVATSETWRDRDSGERREKTEWHRIVCWGGLVDVVADHVRKGDRVCIEGKMEYRSYANNDGVEVYTAEIRVVELLLLGSARGGEGNAPRPPARGNAAARQAAVDNYDSGEDFEDFPRALEDTEEDYPPAEAYPLQIRPALPVEPPRSPRRPLPPVGDKSTRGTRPARRSSASTRSVTKRGRSRG